MLAKLDACAPLRLRARELLMFQIIRAALQSEIGAKLDCSQDPMTVVARGAALYASTIGTTVAELTEAPLKAGAAAIYVATVARSSPEV